MSYPASSHFLLSPNNSIIAVEYRCQQAAYKIGHIILNAEQAMNAVDLDMVKMIAQTLAQWQQDDEIAVVLLSGAGGKVFSAGGDVQKLYHSMQAQGDEYCRYADDFFYNKYKNNYFIKQFKKPIIAWGTGYVMGGGLGLFISSSHKVGSESLKLAWPEAKIGLFPDVTATYHLSRLPAPYGHWMSLSASLMNAVDCRQLKLIDYCLKNDLLEDVISLLINQDWSEQNADNHHSVKSILLDLEQQSLSLMPESHLSNDLVLIDEIIFDQDKNIASLEQIDRNIRTALEQQEGSIWFQQGLKNYLKSCPDTLAIIISQLERGKTMDLKQVVSWELGLAYQSVRKGNFVEGTRALVIDKDQTPNWQHASIAKLSQAWLDEFLASPWPLDQHPYKDL